LALLTCIHIFCRLLGKKATFFNKLAYHFLPGVHRLIFVYLTYREASSYHSEAFEEVGKQRLEDE
jgi:hypothetical protein